MAVDYVDQIRTIQPVGPYHLIGYSFGGLVAHAMAAEIQRRGEKVALLAMLDTYLSNASLRQDRSELDEREDLIALLGADAGILENQPLTVSQVRDAFHDRAGLFTILEDRHISAMVDIMLNSSRLVSEFTPGRIRGDLLFFSATIDRPEHVPTPDAWRDCFDGEVEAHDIASAHVNMMEPRSLAQIGPILAAKLQEISDQVSPSHGER